jgi:hypothetical protein
MEQYDLLLTQNTAASGIEFTEQHVLLTQASILTGQNADGGDPTVLTAVAGDIGKVLKVIDAGSNVPKLGWAVDEEGHSQNTDEGTTNERFYIGGHASDEATEKRGAYLKRIDETDIPVQLDIVNADNGFLKAKASRFYVGQKVPVDLDELTSKEYVDGIIAAADAMVYKGAIDASGNPNYPAANAGWTYKISHAGKIGGASGPVVEVGDMIICTTDDTATGTHAAVGANWNIIQVNIPDTADLVLKSSFTPQNSILASAAADKTPIPLTALANTVLRRGATGNLDFGTLISAHIGNKEVKTANLDDGAVGNTQIGASAGIALSKLEGIAALSVVANAGNSSTTPGVITIGEGDNVQKGVLSERNNLLAFRLIANDNIGNAAGIALTKLADMATASLIYRKTAGSGAPEVNSLATLKTDLGSMPVDWKVAPADKIGTGYSGTAVAGWVAKDANFIYVCDTGGAAGSQAWSRLPRATNWS